MYLKKVYCVEDLDINVVV